MLKKSFKNRSVKSISALLSASTLVLAASALASRLWQPNPTWAR